MRNESSKPTLVKTILLCGVVVCPCIFVTMIAAQKNLDVCRVTTDTRSISQGRGTGIYELGKFPVDDIDEDAKHNFRYETGGRAFEVDVEVEYGDMRDVEKAKPTNITLSLLARNSTDKDNRSILPVEAQTGYRYKWGRLFVSTDVVNGDTAQRFRLTCSDGLSKNGLIRGDPAWLKKLHAKQKH